MDGSLVSSPTTAGEASGADPTPYKADVSALFQRLLPIEFFWAALKQAKVRENNRVYTSAVVVWLMICQRLQAQGTLESAVLELLGGLPRGFWPMPCKRLEQAKLAPDRRAAFFFDGTTVRMPHCEELVET